MLIGKPLLYARPLPTTMRGMKGSFATRMACRAFSSSSRANAISGFWRTAVSTVCRKVMEWTSARKQTTLPIRPISSGYAALSIVHCSGGTLRGAAEHGSIGQRYQDPRSSHRAMLYNDLELFLRQE